MQQRADRGGRRHRFGQPAVKRNDRRLYPKPADAQNEDQRQRQRRDRAEVGWGGELDRADQRHQPDDSCQEGGAAGQGIGQVDAPRAQRFLVAAMHDQRPGRQRQQLVEQEECDHAARHRHAGGGQHAKVEKAEEPRQVRATAEIADGIDRGDQPKKHRQSNE